MTELAALRQKIEASERLLAGDSEVPCSKMVAEELRRIQPELERRVRQLEGYQGAADRRES